MNRKLQPHRGLGARHRVERYGSLSHKRIVSAVYTNPRSALGGDAVIDNGRIHHYPRNLVHKLSRNADAPSLDTQTRHKPQVHIPVQTRAGIPAVGQLTAVVEPKRNNVLPCFHEASDVKLKTGVAISPSTCFSSINIDRAVPVRAAEVQKRLVIA